MLIDFAPQFISCFKSLLQTLDSCKSHIQTKLIELPLWVDNGADEFVNHRDKVIFALGNFSPTQGLSPQETFKCPGVVAGTKETLGLIDEVNQAKSTFKQLVRTCHQTMQHDITKFVRDTLAHAGYPGIKLKQVFGILFILTIIRDALLGLKENTPPVNNYQNKLQKNYSTKQGRAYILKYKKQN